MMYQHRNFHESYSNPGTAIKNSAGLQVTASFTREGGPQSIISDGSPLPFLDKTFNATPDNKPLTKSGAKYSNT